MRKNQDFTLICLIGLSIIAILKGYGQTATLTGVISNDYDICKYFKDGVKLRKPGYCNYEITCQGHKSIDSSVCPPGKSILLSTLKCGSASDNYCKSPCKTGSPLFTQDPKNCAGWYKCNDKETLLSGHCNAPYYFEESMQLCVPESSSECVATYKFCDVVPENVNIPDFDNCHKYFRCNSKQNLDEYTCPLGTYFDIDSGICIKKSQVNCYKHPYPENVCGTTKVPYRNVFVSDQATCRGYFYCKDTGNYTTDETPTWGQCPLGKFFIEKYQACIATTEVKCLEDRCDGIENGFALSEKYGCQHYLECKNNSTLSEEKCPNNEYFNASTQQCTTKVQTYPACS